MKRSLVAGRYLLGPKLGSGATSSVYRASDEDGTAVAIKVVHPHVANQRAATERLLREAKTIAKLDHPNTVKVLDWGIHLGEPYVVLELVGGEDLGKVLTREHKLPVKTALQIAIDIADALRAAHDIGVVHRDLKPANVMMLKDGSVKVLDFGLARMLPKVSEDTIPNELTRPGTVLGTPTHMAPEQLRRSDVDGRADIYGCGVLLFEMLTGELPITADNAIAVLMAIATEKPTAPRELDPNLSVELERVILRCLEKQPADRFQRASDLRDALVGVLADETAPGGPSSVQTVPFPNEDLPTMPLTRKMLEPDGSRPSGPPPPPQRNKRAPQRQKLASEDMPTLRQSALPPQPHPRDFAAVQEATTRRMNRQSGAPPRATRSAAPKNGGRKGAEDTSAVFELHWKHIAATIGVLLMVVAALWAIV